MIGWSIFSLVTSLVPVLWGWQLLRRALPKGERVDLSCLAKGKRWEAAQLRTLTGTVGDFAREVFAEGTEAGRVDLVCERLASVDAETRQFSVRLRMLGRTVFAGGAFMSILLISQAVQAGVSQRIVIAFAPAVACTASALCCYWMGRVFSSPIEDRRRVWDALSRALVVPHMSGPHMGGDVPASERGVRRRTKPEVMLADLR